MIMNLCPCCFHGNADQNSDGKLLRVKFSFLSNDSLFAGRLNIATTKFFTKVRRCFFMYICSNDFFSLK